MFCRVCGKVAKDYFKGLVLGKYEVQYFECTSCGFVQTEDPYWLGEAYSNAITESDVGLVWRNIKLAKKSAEIIDANFDCQKRFLDYAGGYGLFVRLMRDRGFNFYRQDSYCQNLFATHFDISDLPWQEKFELTTAFEVFEHLSRPSVEIGEILKTSNSLLFSTELLLRRYKCVNEWWYFSPETGQHVSFYTYKSLEILADRYNVHFYTNGKDLHMFSSIKMDPGILLSRKLTIKQRILNKILLLVRKSSAKEHNSFLSHDLNLIKEIMNKRNG